MFDIEVSIETVIFRLVLAAILGGIIGWEREMKNKQAGFKTHLLVSLGSALIMLISIYGFGPELMNHPNARFDPARLAAQVVSGIGFLGAGAILRRSDRVISGLTTAATLWLVAGIGLSVGAGFYWPAVITIAIVLLSVYVINKIEHKFNYFKKQGNLKLVMVDQPDGVQVITDLLQREYITVEQISLKEQEDSGDGKRVIIQFRIHSKKPKETLDLFSALWAIDGIKEVEIMWKD
ncbi:MAG: MgtC/SapB family protein [Candidatus Cohnella colombiensis]|uniref:MgtC/SapB family protein n=1 Tax=Candidatus Cohnella colombiensis TaxID=3121368 RepID=A0AA95EVP6_9BACL|nr:MAG: MgtC/SapB family protein [Cohnella sp.]